MTDENPIIPIWTLDTAVLLVRSLHEKLIDSGCTIALGGSCLHRGFSAKDVDIIIHPLDCEELSKIERGEFDFTNAKKCLEKAGLKYIRKAHSDEYSIRTVEVWNNSEGRRIDVFFMDA